MSYLTEELKVESLYLLNYFMKSEQDESGSKELGFILDKITKRSDFVKASKGQYIKTSALFLQKVKRDDKKNPRYGITASKKIGNAVKRNKIRRKLKAIVQKLLKKKGAINKDYTYIVFGKSNAYAQKQDVLLPLMEKSFSKLKK